MLLVSARPVLAAPGPDVTITKEGSVASAGQGDSYSYTLTATNIGDATATAVLVSDGSIDFPDVTVTSATATTGSCTVDTDIGSENNVDCTLGDMAPSQAITVTINVTVSESFCDGLVRNTADISASNEPAENQANNTSAPATQTDIVCDPTPGVDVAITKAASVTSAILGQSYTYTLTAENIGTATATGVEVRDGSIDFPDVTVDSATATTGSCTVDTDPGQENNVACDLGDMAGSASITITIGVTVSTTTCDGSVTNTAQISATNEPSEVMANNSDVANVAINCGGGGEHPFTDVAGNEFEDDITWIYNEGITLGCTPTMYCPADSVTRVQMASFLVRAGNLPAPTGDHFTDDEAYGPAEDDINSLFEAGITTGCGPTTFCPDGLVTRAQMASFLTRALDLPAPVADHFTDDENVPVHEADINSLADAGITQGCNPAGTLYCPLREVRRDEMAAFLHRAFGP